MKCSYLFKFLGFAFAFGVICSPIASAEELRKRTSLHNMLSMSTSELIKKIPGEETGMLEYVLRNGYSKDVNQKDHVGNTPLMIASQVTPDARVISMLIRYGAKVNAVNDEGNSALHLAAAHNQNPKVIEVLLENGAQVNLSNNSGRTPLHRIGVYQENPQVLETLLVGGASAFVRNDHGELPIDIIKKNPHLKSSYAFRLLQESTR